MHMIEYIHNTNAKGGEILGPCRKLTKYKCLAPAQNRLPNALVGEMKGLG